MCFLMCGLVVAPTPVIAQSTTDYVVGGIATVASALFSAFKSKKKPKSAYKSKKKSKKMQNTNDSTVTLTTTEDLATNASYQSTSDMDSVHSTPQRNMTIVTKHPDFSVKVKRCMASGKTVIIDLILENLGTDDVSLEFYNGNSYSWDSEGNCFTNFFKYANNETYHFQQSGVLLPGIPTKFSVKIEDVPVSAERIAKMQIPVICNQWGLSDVQAILIRNIPITRQ